MKNTITSKENKVLGARKKKTWQFTAETAAFISILDVVKASFEFPPEVSGPWGFLPVAGEEKKKKRSRADHLFVSASEKFVFWKYSVWLDKSCFGLMCFPRPRFPEGIRLFSLPDKNNWANIFNIQPHTRQTFTVTFTFSDTELTEIRTSSSPGPTSVKILFTKTAMNLFVLMVTERGLGVI